MVLPHYSTWHQQCLLKDIAPRSIQTPSADITPWHATHLKYIHLSPTTIPFTPASLTRCLWALSVVIQNILHSTGFLSQSSFPAPCFWECSTPRASKNLNKWKPGQLYRPGFYHTFEPGHLLRSIQLNNSVESAGMVYTHSQDLRPGKATQFYYFLKKVFLSITLIIDAATEGNHIGLSSKANHRETFWD